MNYKLLYNNIIDLFCGQTIVAWKNLKAQDDSLFFNDDLLGILSYQLPKHGIYGKFYEPNMMNIFSLVLKLRKANWDTMEGIP